MQSCAFRCSQAMPLPAPDSGCRSSAHLIHLPCCRPPVQISAFFPGHHAKAMQQNAEMRKMEEEVQGLLAGRSLICISAGYACAVACVGVESDWRQRRVGHLKTSRSSLQSGVLPITPAWGLLQITLPQLSNTPQACPPLRRLQLPPVAPTLQWTLTAMPAPR